MSGNDRPRVLCVDDERNVLDGLRRTLRHDFDVEVASSGKAGLPCLARETFAVVVSDLRMPEMDGIEFLKRARDQSPDSTRILLTGNADVSAAISAVNEGNVFRFLAKPCPASVIIPAISSAAEQHRLVTAERVLLQKTLLGSVKMLIEVLALANPTAFGRAMRIKQRAGDVAARLGDPERWKMEMAAMLSQVACITLPRETLESLYRGETLSSSGQAMVDRLPEVAESLLAEVPRIEDVRAILRQQNSPMDGEGSETVPLGSRILKAVLDLDILESQEIPIDSALEALRRNPGRYDSRVLLALADSPATAAAGETIMEVPVSGLKTGMILIDPVRGVDDRLLVAHGQEVSIGLIERLINISQNMGVKEPLRVSLGSTQGGSAD